MLFWLLIFLTAPAYEAWAFWYRRGHKADNWTDTISGGWWAMQKSPARFVLWPLWLDITLHFFFHTSLLPGVL